MPNGATPEEILDLKQGFDAFKTDLSGMLAKQTEEMKQHGKTTEETGAKLAEAHKKFADLEGSVNAASKDMAERVGAIEKRLERPDFGAQAATAIKTMGQKFVESEAFKEFLNTSGARESRDVEIDLRAFAPNEEKAITSGNTGSALLLPYRDSGISAAPPRRLTVVDLVHTLTVGKAASAEYVKQSARYVLYTTVGSTVSIGDGTATVDSVAGIIPGSVVTFEAEEMTVAAGGVNRTTKVLTFTANFAAGHAVGTKVTASRFSYTPETEVRPRGKLEFELISLAFKTIARWIPVSIQMMSDMPTVQSLVDVDLRRAHDEEREHQVLYGDGTARDLEGFMSLSDANTYTMSDVAGDVELDAVRRAFTVLFLLNYQPSGAVLHPSKKEAIDLAKGEDGHYMFIQYLLQNGLQQIQQVPLLSSGQMVSTDFLVADFGIAATLYRRAMINIRVGEPEDYFLRGMKAIMAESREGLAHKRPDAVIKGSFL